ncbi:acyltransferase family protein [Oxalobacteraceae bacterium A2-2]
MDTLSIIPAIVAIMLAVLSGYCIARWGSAPPDHGGTSSLDGLRGYLAFFVFIHHASYWRFYLLNGHWVASESHVYTHMGKSSVALFFMLTAFLFFNKVLDSADRPIDWSRLYLSRFMRITPLYLFAVAVMCIIVATLSQGQQNSSFRTNMAALIHWLAFTALRMPDLNGIRDTYLITAGVTWSLPYEWGFYFLLPLLAALTRRTVPLSYIVFSLLALLFIVANALHSHYFPFPYLYFLGGLIASLLYRQSWFKHWAGTPVASVIAVLCVVATVIYSHFPDQVISIVLLTITFSIISSGNTLFGALTTPSSRVLGDMAYSIYLLHGILLYISFNLWMGPERARELAPSAHWLLVWALTPLLIALCYLTHRFIETPGINQTHEIYRRIKQARCPVRKARN